MWTLLSRACLLILLYGYCTGYIHRFGGGGRGVRCRSTVLCCAVLCSELFINQDLEQAKTGGLILMECWRWGILVK